VTATAATPRTGPVPQPYGLWLVRALADQVTITSGTAGTRAAVDFTLSAGQPRPGSPAMTPSHDARSRCG
jgi:hypothetical protein